MSKDWFTEKELNSIEFGLSNLLLVAIKIGHKRDVKYYEELIDKVSKM